MSMLDQFRLFADYNRLMNRRIFEAAGQLSDEDLRNDRGAFFKSLLGTLNHILVGDIIWLKRFQSHPPSARVLGYLDTLDNPESLSAILFDDLDALLFEREKIDLLIIEWIDNLADKDLADTLRYRNMAGAAHEKPVVSLISHLFLHQVHHRGQATTLISQSGVDFGDTDLLEIIAESSR